MASSSGTEKVKSSQDEPKSFHVQIHVTPSLIIHRPQAYIHVLSEAIRQIDY